jgi:hypothetical protein
LHETSAQDPVLQLVEALASAQVTPHPPQLALVVRSVSHPFAALWSQSAKPRLQDPTAQALFTHAGVALGITQALPHAPQFCGELVRFVSHPSSPLLLQSAKPGLQVTV